MADAKSISTERKRNWAWIWLGYTGFLFIQPIMEPSRNLWLSTLAVFVVFLGIFSVYVEASDKRQQKRYWMIAATFALGLFCFPWNQGASTFFVYTAAFLPFSIESARRVLWLFLLECLLIFAEGFFFHRYAPNGPFSVNWPNTYIAIFLVVIIGGGNIFFAEQKRSECRLRAAQEENLALAALAERERIARDLHDVLGHTLSVVVLKAELAARLVTIDPQRAIAEMQDVERTSRTALAEVREAIGGYRARGLAAEIDAARLTFDAAGITLIAESNSAHTAALSPQEETALALVLREAVTNIVRHARATTCYLRFVSESDRRQLVVEDNGQHTVTREGNGLRGMRERIESLGGKFSLERGIAQDRGTRLTIDHAAARGICLMKNASSAAIRVLLVEDQTMLRGALASLLELEVDLTVIAQAANGHEALKLVNQHQPDVIVTDIEMPQRTGLELAADLKASGSKARIIILTTFARPGYLRRALDAGARGYLLKDRPASELAEAIRRVHAGVRAVDPALAAEAWGADEDPLTDRERQILQRAGDGRSSAEIASELRLSEGTVRNYLSEAIAKLGAANRTDAARIARARGWL